MIALSESVKKNCVECPLAEKSWWRHIRLAIKHRYLGNHASQTKSYYGTLAGNHGRSIRFRHKNRLKCPLAKDWRWRHVRLAIKPRYLKNHASQIQIYYGTLSGNHGRSFRIRHEKLREAPLAEDWRWRHVRLSIKPRYLGNNALQIKSYYGPLTWNLGRLVIFIKNGEY